MPGIVGIDVERLACLITKNRICLETAAKINRLSCHGLDRDDATRDAILVHLDRHDAGGECPSIEIGHMIVKGAGSAFENFARKAKDQLKGLPLLRGTKIVKRGRLLLAVRLA